MAIRQGCCWDWICWELAPLCVEGKVSEEGLAGGDDLSTIRLRFGLLLSPGEQWARSDQPANQDAPHRRLRLPLSLLLFKSGTMVAGKTSGNGRPPTRTRTPLRTHARYHRPQL